jgi:hypothetical protein
MAQRGVDRTNMGLNFLPPRMQERAGGGFMVVYTMFRTGHTTTTSLTCNSELEVVFMVF